MQNTIITLRNISKSYHGQAILTDISLDIKKGEFLTLLGPSGCGKTTLLRIISGFEEPDSGDVLISDQSVLGIPANLRHINTIFQSYALFPHMTIFDNVAFGLRCQKLPSAEIKQRVNDVLATVKLNQYQQRKPAQLSGGQQQRVAIARAIVNQPLVLLLDEPFSALDYRLRKTMQIELRQLQRKLGIAFIFVTHDQEEALSMSDRVVVLDNGIVQQIGTPREVYEKPCNLRVAKFIGEVNIFQTRVEKILDERIMVTIANKPFTLKYKKTTQVGEQLHILVRPEDFRVYGEDEITENEHMFPGIVEEVIYKGTTVDLIVRLAGNFQIYATEFFDEDDDSLVYTIGEKVWAHWVPDWEVILPYEN